MKILTIALAVCLLLATTGCPRVKANVPAQALPPGALNSFDATTYETLNAMHSFVVSQQAQIAAGSYKPSAPEVNALNVLIAALNAADLTYAAYHNGVATQAAVEAQLAQVRAANTTVQTALTGAK